MLNYRSVVLTFTPDPARGIALVASDPPLAGVQVDASVPLNDAPCADWRGALRADFGDPLRLRFGGSYPAACAEQTWPTAYADPARYDERALRGMWQSMGGRLSGTVRDGIAPASPPSFASTSPPLAAVIRDINKFSNNVMAQQLFLTLGLTQRGAGTPDAARAVLRDWATSRFGDAASALKIENGSGLSRDGRVSARLLARLLLAAWSGPMMPELMSSLPVSGVDGTLKDSRAPLARAHMKTGSLRDVAGVAGYVLANSGRRYVVVAIANHPDAGAARPAFDALIDWAVDDAPHPDPRY
jgi:D-alanyl-D-alanine carboxypeptidase/D-alanyl-D-alanine-endopeptidase (penicillin-binding protein 4)